MNMWNLKFQVQEAQKTLSNYVWNKHDFIIFFDGMFESSQDRGSGLRADPDTKANMLGGFGQVIFLLATWGTICPPVKWGHAENSKGLF